MHPLPCLTGHAQPGYGLRQRCRKPSLGTGTTYSAFQGGLKDTGREHTSSITRRSINTHQRSERALPTPLLFSITSHFPLPPVMEDLKQVPARVNQNSLSSNTAIFIHPCFCFFHWNSILWLTVCHSRKQFLCGMQEQGHKSFSTSALLYCQSPNRCWVLFNRSDFTDAGIRILL